MEIGILCQGKLIE